MIREHVFRIDEGGETWFRWLGITPEGVFGLF